MISASLFQVKPEQKRKAIEQLIESSSPTQSFFLVLIISAVITTIGILLDNVAVVIGGMLVSPLLSPILAIALGVVLVDNKLIMRSIRVLLLAIAFVVGISLIFSFFVIDKQLNNEILSRANPSMAYFFIAFASGIAAAFAYAKEEFSPRIVGVAVAIALLPPLSVIGIGIAFWSLSVLAGSIGLFLVNLLGILLGSLIVFSLLRLYPEKKVAQLELKAEEKEFEQLKNHNHK